MSRRLAISGAGRVARDLFRALLAAGTPPAAIAADASAEALCYLLRYDTLRGRQPAELSLEGETLVTPAGPVRLIATGRGPAAPGPDWRALGVAGVLDAGPRPPGRAALAAHLQAGAAWTLACGGSAEGDARDYDATCLDAAAALPRGGVLGAGSVALHAARDVVAAVSQRFGIERLFVTDVRGVGEDQGLADGPGPDLRLARAAAANIVPASSPLAGPLTAALPALAGRVAAMAVRVPVSGVGMLDMTAFTREEVSVAAANAHLATAAAATSGRLACCDDPIVAADVRGTLALATLDTQATMAVGGRSVKLLAWYDLGWGYAHHVAALARRLGGTV